MHGIAFLKRDGSQSHTPPTENTHCKISSLALRRSAINLLGVRIRSVCLARAHLTFEPTRDITFSRRGMLTVGHVQEQCEQCGQCELL